MKNLLVLAICLTSILVLAACGDDVTPTPRPPATGTPSPTATSLPPPTLTSTPPPTPTTTPIPTPVPGPLEMTNAYLAAFNAGDVEALRDIYKDSVVFTLGNLPFGPSGQPITESYTGRASAIEEHLDSIAANAKIILSNARVVGNAVKGRFSYTDDRDETHAIGPLTGVWETVTEGGKISSLTMTLDDETYQRWKAATVAASTPLSPIVVAEGTARQDVMSQLPDGEVECIRQHLGETAFGQFSRSDFSQDTSEVESEALSRCLNEEPLSRFFIGLAVSELGELSDATIACMGDVLSAHDMRAVFFDEGFWEAAFQAIVGCLSDEERALAEAKGFFGDEGVPGTPGLVDVDGRQLYLTCQGAGGPTVVMEAGGRGNSGSWYLVQPEVAHFTRVCAYDRAGTGYSESVPAHSAAQAIADDLHSLLENAGVSGPYVLVGHSLGGVLVRVFTSLYPEEVAGMVLVDTGHGDPRARFQAVLTPEEWQRVRAVILHDDGFTLPAGLDLLGPDLGDIPLVVLTAGRRDASPLPADIVERLDQVRQDTQEELLTLSSNSTHIIAEGSGHSIQKDQPEAVVDAIRQVVAGVRTRDQPAQ